MLVEPIAQPKLQTATSRARPLPTHRQMALFNAIVEFKKANDGNSPSSRDLIRVTDYTSTSVLQYNLRQLEAAGLIEIDRHITRMIRVVGGQWSYTPELEARQPITT